MPARQRFSSLLPLVLSLVIRRCVRPGYAPQGPSPLGTGANPQYVRKRVERPSVTQGHERPEPRDFRTGAAAAALGGYLRDASLVPAPFEFEIRQGASIGMPSRIFVDVPDEGGIIVRGTARSI